MEGNRFDEAVRALTSRRSLLGIVTAGVALARSGVPASARRHHHHRCSTQICFGSCIPSLAVCCSNPAGYWCDPGTTCCPPTTLDANGFCAGDIGAVCCPAAAGGGWCDAGSTCCAPSPGDPDGLCAPTGWYCCDDAAGGACLIGERCCPPTSADPEGYCVGSGDFCAAGFAAASVRATQAHRRRFVKRGKARAAHWPTDESSVTAEGQNHGA